MNALPSASVSVISEIARATFPARRRRSFMYYVVQALTFAILVLAANTSYQGFPRLAAVLARDRFFPRQFVNLGDRLVYSNGIVVLAGLAALLIWVFDADVDRADPPLRDRRLHRVHALAGGHGALLAAGASSRAGAGARWSTALGAIATGRRRACSSIETKFTQGAWVVIVAIPLLVARASTASDRHYRKVARRLRAGVAAVAAAPPRDQPRRPLRRVVRRGARARRSGTRAQIAGDDFRRDPRARAAHRPGIRPRFRQLDGHAARPRDHRRRRTGASTR